MVIYPTKIVCVVVMRAEEFGGLLACLRGEIEERKMNSRFDADKQGRIG